MKRLTRLAIFFNISLVLWSIQSIVITSHSFAQIQIPQYNVGEYRNDVVFVGTYGSPGYCNFTDGLDFVLNLQQLVFPTGMTLAVVIDPPVPANLNLTAGWGGPINVGDSIIITPSDYTVGIAALAAGTINFHVTASGTPTTADETYPCWVDQLMTLSDCNNTWQLLAGESLVPCVVQGPQSISDHSTRELIDIKENSIIWMGNSEIRLEFFSIEGKAIMDPVRIRRSGTVTMPDGAVGTYIIRATDGQTEWHRLIHWN